MINNNVFVDSQGQDSTISTPNRHRTIKSGLAIMVAAVALTACGSSVKNDSQSEEHVKSPVEAPYSGVITSSTTSPEQHIQAVDQSEIIRPKVQDTAESLAAQIINKFYGQDGDRVYSINDQSGSGATLNIENDAPVNGIDGLGQYHLYAHVYGNEVGVFDPQSVDTLIITSSVNNNGELPVSRTTFTKRYNDNWEISVTKGHGVNADGDSTAMFTTNPDFADNGTFGHLDDQALGNVASEVDRLFLAASEHATIDT